MKRKMKTGKAGRGRKWAAWAMLALTAWMIFSPTAQALRALPDTFRLTVGQQYTMDVGAAVLSSQDERLNLHENTLTPREAGETEVTLNLFGLFPIGRMRVKAGEAQKLMPGGAAVGVALASKGVLVVGVSDVAGKSPAQSAGLRAGDVIETVNGQSVESSKHLTELVALSRGMPLTLRYSRDGVRRTATLTPSLDGASGQWRIGAWVRDSTAGVGTLSYYNMENGTYGALGHAISDADTGKLVPVRTGSLMKAEIVGVKQGKRGVPGELQGSFLKDQVVLGNIEGNTQLGIFGEMDAPYVNPLYPEGLPIGYRETVETGPATILSTIQGETMKEYSVEIVQTNRQMTPGPKSMVIKVTDPELLALTGGIVQGMSGSPILQNGRIIGAVTHVQVILMMPTVCLTRKPVHHESVFPPLKAHQHLRTTNQRRAAQARLFCILRKKLFVSAMPSVIRVRLHALENYAIMSGITEQ